MMHRMGWIRMRLVLTLMWLIRVAAFVMLDCIAVRVACGSWMTAVSMHAPADRRRAMVVSDVTSASIVRCSMVGMMVIRRVVVVVVILGRAGSRLGLGRRLVLIVFVLIFVRLALIKTDQEGYANKNEQFSIRKSHFGAALYWFYLFNFLQNSTICFVTQNFFAFFLK